jgi:hypothetical protein
VLRDEVVDHLVDDELGLIDCEIASRRKLAADLGDEAIASRDKRVGDLQRTPARTAGSGAALAMTARRVVSHARLKPPSLPAGQSAVCAHGRVASF